MRSVEIWERDPKYTQTDLENEASRRNHAENASEREAEGESGIKQALASELSEIWGAGWKPEGPLDFPVKIKSDFVRKEVIRFVAEGMMAI